MKTTTKILSVSVFAALAFAACGPPLEVDLPGDDAEPAAEPEAQPEPAPEPEAQPEPAPEPEAQPEPAPEPEPDDDCNFLNPALDCDGDGRTGQADCDPYNDDSYLGAPELCDAVDNDCDGQVNEGCAAPPVGGGNQPVDADGDGSWTLVGQPDCNDQDSTVKPGATELCDNKDNDCDGTTDEGCGITPPPSTNGSVLTIVVNYPSPASRKLSVQVANTAGQLGGWWDKEVPSSGTGLATDLASVPDGACWLRFNVAQDNVKWLCMGNGSTASLDPDAGVSIAWKGKTYTKSDLIVWSAPGGTAAGCSALFKLKPECSL